MPSCMNFLTDVEPLLRVVLLHAELAVKVLVSAHAAHDPVHRDLLNPQVPHVISPLLFLCFVEGLDMSFL